MTIEIHESELEALILRRMESGRFGSVEEALLEALKTSPESEKLEAHTKQTKAKLDSTQIENIRSKSLYEIFEPIRGLFADGELNFERDRSECRPVDF